MLGTSTTTTYYTDSAAGFTIWGMKLDGDALVPSANTPLPLRAKVGAQGPLYTGKTYVDGWTIAPETYVGTWSLDPDTPQTAWLCFIQTIRTGSSTLPSSTSNCWRIDQNGTINGRKILASTNGQSVAFQ